MGQYMVGIISTVKMHALVLKFLGMRKMFEKFTTKQSSKPQTACVGTGVN